MQNNKNSISVTELLKELKANGFKKIDDEYVDIKECARVSKGLSL